MRFTLIHASISLFVWGMLCIFLAKTNLREYFARRGFINNRDLLNYVAILLGSGTICRHGHQTAVKTVQLEAYQILCPVIILIAGIIFDYASHIYTAVIEIRRGERDMPWWAEIALVILLTTTPIIALSGLLYEFAD